MARRPRTGLNERETIFVAEYLKDLNATEAAVRAGYSPRTAKQQGSRLLTRVDVGDAIARRRAALQQALEVEQESILRGFLRIAGADPRKLFRATDNGRQELVPVHELPDEVALAIAGVKVRTFTPDIGLPYQVIDFKFESRSQALTRLGQHLGLFSDVDKRPVEGTGVLRTPAPATAAEWSRVAQLQQAALGKDPK